MSPEATIAYLTIAVAAILLLLSRRTKKSTDQSKKERLAKESFRVRKSNLLAVSGRGRNKRKFKHQPWRFDGSRKCVGESASVDNVSWLYRLLHGFKEYFRQDTKSTPKHIPQTRQPSRLPPKINLDNYFDNIQVVGLDCEMVGGGKGGYTSMLARCSVVTLDCVPIKSDSNSKLTSINQNLVVLYDKYVIPKGRITDYRAQWSGITKETYDGGHNVPIVTFHQCQKEITELFSSIDGLSVMVVGHALENDFDALEIKHPDALTRDTSLYRPYMRQVRRRLFPRKLSTLSSEELGIEIQQEPNLIDEMTTEGGVNDPNEYTAAIGHSSIEDAAAALRLYWHKCQDWERSLRYPLLPSNGSASFVRKWPPINTFYLDSCNLPVGLRGVDFKQLLNSDTEAASNQTIASKSVRLVSRQSDKASITTTDWIPYFRSALLPGVHPQIERFVIMFDGAKFRDITKTRDWSKVQKVNTFQTRSFRLESPKDHGAIAIEITQDGDAADDVLYHLCNGANIDEAPLCRIVSLQQAADLFSSMSNDNDQLSSYIVIRRKAGGSKTHRRLFDKLHLRRPNEGALCLSGLTSNLQRDSWRTIRELQRERAVERVIECELRRRDELVHVVVTDDVYLTERLINLGTVMVLSYRQMEHMF